MPHLPLSRLRPVFDLHQQLRLNPDALVRDLLAVGLRLPDQRRQFLPQLRRRSLVEPVVDLASVNKTLALAAADVDAVPLTLIECEARNGQRLALRASLLHPIVAPAGDVAAVAHLRDDAFETDRAGMPVHLGALD